MIPVTSMTDGGAGFCPWRMPRWNGRRGKNGMCDDQRLMDAIHKHADKADANRLHFVDIRAVAVTLHARFGHRSEADILGQLTDVFEARGLLWQ